MERKNFRVHPVEQDIPYAVSRAYDNYMLGYITREQYCSAVSYVMALHSRYNASNNWGL